MQQLQRTQGIECYKTLCSVIPGGVNSPVRAFKGLGLPPLIVRGAKADLLHDVDGNSFIDYCCSWGPLIHGHCHPDIIAAAQKQMALGCTFGVTTPIEGDLAGIIIRHMPSIEKIRFVSSGTEATMSAVRLARAVTERDIIVKFSGNYHGHADMFLMEAGSGVLGITPTSTSAGIPEAVIQNTWSLPYNDIAACREFLMHPDKRDNIAAVIIEPIAGNMGCVASTAEFLAFLRKATTEIGALLIFDEVITGFRTGLSGAQGLYGIRPDLTCLGKIIGGGFPAAAFGGPKEIMDLLAPLGTVYQAGTLSGNPVAMAAGLKSIQMLEAPGFYEELERKTRIITDPIQELLESRKGVQACLQRVGSMFTLFFGARQVKNMDDARKLDGKMFNDFFRFMFTSGVYIPPAQQEVWFTSAAHTESHLLKTRDLIISFFK